VLCRGLETIDRSGFLLPGVPRRSNMLGLQQRTAKEIRRDLQDYHGYRDRSHCRVTRLSKRMASGNYSRIQRLVTLSGPDCNLSHQLQRPEGCRIYK